MDEALSIEPFDPKKHKPIDTVGGMKATEYLASETSPEGTAWNIPTIWFDKDTKEPVFLGDKDTVDRAWNAAYRYEEETGIKFPRYKDIKEAETAAGNRSNKGGATKQKLGMAKGGISMALNDETEAVFKSMRGQEIDPVSGNEVPLGSEPEEVRDDIDAKLSEGEYVVPADVVKYYGVKFFEDLRNEAKLGFANMQSNGRIGGEPIAEEGLPFDVSELQMVEDGQPTMNKGGYMSGYAEGGEVLNPYSNPTGGGFEIREYVDSSGNIMYIQFMNGKPLTPIPEGYSLKGTAAEEVAEQVQETPRRGNDDRTDVRAVPEAIDWDTVDIDKFEETAKQYDNPLGKGMLMMMGPFGLVGKLMLSHQKNQIIKAIDKRLENPDLQNREQWLGVKNNFLDVKNDPTAEDGTKVEKDAMGNTIITGPDGEVVDTSRIGRGSYIDDLLGMDGKWGVQGPGLMDSIKGARKDFESARPPRDPKGSPGKGFVTSGDGSIVRDGNGKPVKTGRYEQDKPLVPQLRESSKKKQSIAVAKKEKDMGTKLSSARTTKDKKETYSSKARRGGGFSKGGLVNKPKKK